MSLIAPLVFTAEDEARLREVFQKLDREKKGFIVAEDLRRLCMEALGHEMKAEKAEELLLRCDPNKVGRIEYEHFVKAMSVVLPKLIAAIVMVAVFRTLDPDNTGFIARAELEKLVRESGIEQKIERARIDEIIMKTNPGADGRIEFKLFMAGIVAHLRAL